MRWVSRAKFAAITGISRKSVSSAVARGDVTFVGEGGQIKIDLQGPLTKEYMAKFEGGGGRQAGKTAEKAPKVASPDQADHEVSEADLEDMRGVLLSNMEQLSKPELDRLKALEQVRALKQKTDQARLKLIDRDLVARCFSKIYAVDVNELRTLGANLAPGLASIFGADRPDLILQAEQTIEAEVFKVLEHVKRIISDFLKSIKAEPLK
jgi:hypothetical protein